MSEIVRKGPIAHISIHFAAEELVGIWMKYRVISKTLYKEIDEAGFFPTYTELRPMPHVDGLSPALRGSQILYIEVQPREAVFHE